MIKLLKQTKRKGICSLVKRHEAETLFRAPNPTSCSPAHRRRHFSLPRRKGSVQTGPGCGQPNKRAARQLSKTGMCHFQVWWLKPPFVVPWTLLCLPSECLGMTHLQDKVTWGRGESLSSPQEAATKCARYTPCLCSTPKIWGLSAMPVSLP